MPESDRELELLREGVAILRKQGRFEEAVRLAERVRAIEAERSDAPGTAEEDEPSAG